jgi:hypothetical protein
LGVELRLAKARLAKLALPASGNFSEGSRKPFLGITMEDVIWIAVTVAFFSLSIAYVYFCDRVK